MTQFGRASDRGATPVIAIVLMIGMVGLLAMAIFVAGGALVDATAQSAESDRAAQGFVQLGADVSDLTGNEADRSTSTLDLGGSGGTVATEDDATFSLVTSGQEEPIAEVSVGSIEYHQDGERVAYQAGGVWKQEGEATRMVSAPQMSYRAGSLTLPVIDLDGAAAVDQDEVVLEHRASTAPLQDRSTVEGEMVTLVVESAYYDGWASFFEQRVGESAVLVDHDQQRVEVNLGQPLLDGGYDNAVYAAGDVTLTATGCIEGTVTIGGDLEESPQCQDVETENATDGEGPSPIDEAVTLAVELASEHGTELDNESLDGQTLTNGTYYVDGDLHLDNEELELDVTDGNVTVVVDGHVAIDNSRIEVTGTEDSGDVVQVYSTGDVAIGGGSGGIVNDADPMEDEAGSFQLFGTSEMVFGLGQGEYVGTLYAPREDPANRTNEAAERYGLGNAMACDDIDGEPPDVCIGQGDVHFIGSIVSGHVAVEQSATVTWTESLEDVETRFTLDGVVLPPELTYLNVVVHEVDVHAD